MAPFAGLSFICHLTVTPGALVLYAHCTDVRTGAWRGVNPVLKRAGVTRSCRWPLTRVHEVQTLAWGSRGLSHLELRAATTAEGLGSLAQTATLVLPHLPGEPSAVQ